MRGEVRLRASGLPFWGPIGEPEGGRGRAGGSRVLKGLPTRGAPVGLAGWARDASRRLDPRVGPSRRCGPEDRAKRLDCWGRDAGRSEWTGRVVTRL